MVHLTRIYTRFGDQGECMLGDGSTAPKHSIRVVAYGGVDEANCAVGAAILECPDSEHGRALRVILLSVQQDLFDVGADLCTPIKPDEKDGERLRIVAGQVTRLESLIDEHNAALKPLRSFVLPGGTRLAAALHIARAVTRRAERDASALAAAEEAATNRQAVVYLNRLSDLLFVLARVANGNGTGDVLWEPGRNRS